MSDAQLIIQSGSTWRFLQTRVEPAEDWKTSREVTAPWGEGGTPMGYSDERIQTRLLDGSDPVFLQRRVVLTQGTPFLKISVLTTHAAVVYVNGVEVFRPNLPAGDITSESTSMRYNPTWETYWEHVAVANPTPESLTLTVAVQFCLSYGVADTVLFDLSVEGTDAMPPSPSPLPSRPPTKQHMLAPFSDWDLYIGVAGRESSDWNHPNFDVTAASDWSSLPVVGAEFGPHSDASTPYSLLRVSFLVDTSDIQDTMEATLRIQTAGEASVWFNGGSSPMGSLAEHQYTTTWLEIPIDYRELVSGENVLAIRLRVTQALPVTIQTQLELSVVDEDHSDGSAVLIPVPRRGKWHLWDRGVALPTAWKEQPYSDYLWPISYAPFGYGRGDENTVTNFGSDGQNRYITTYFRTSFDIPLSGSVTSCSVEIMTTCGAAAYVNGQRVAVLGLDVDTSQEFIPFSQLASSARELQYVQFSIDPSILWQGRNSLAIEVHLCHPTDTSLFFDASLRLAHIGGNTAISTPLASASPHESPLPLASASLEATPSPPPLDYLCTNCLYGTVGPCRATNGACYGYLNELQRSCWAGTTACHGSGMPSATRTPTRTPTRSSTPVHPSATALSASKPPSPTRSTSNSPSYSNSRSRSRTPVPSPSNTLAASRSPVHVPSSDNTDDDHVVITDCTCLGATSGPCYSADGVCFPFIPSTSTCWAGTYECIVGSTLPKPTPSPSPAPASNSPVYPSATRSPSTLQNPTPTSSPVGDGGGGGSSNGGDPGNGQLPATTCGNDICESTWLAQGETCGNCPHDCGPCQGSTTAGHTCVESGKYALTFDDGPSIVTPRLLDILSYHGVKATFFVVGRQLEKYGGTLARELTEGHWLSSHSYTHPNLPLQSTEAVYWEMKNTEAAFSTYVCHEPRTMRPPYGAHDPTVLWLLGRMGYRAVMWNVDTNDWQYADTQLEFMLNTLDDLINAESPGSIIHLQHDLLASSVESVDTIIGMIRSKGYDFTSVPQCMYGPNFLYHPTYVFEHRRCGGDVVDWPNVACPISDWSMWSDCDAQCDGGTQTRVRFSLPPSKATTAACANQEFIQSRTCNTHACTSYCEYSAWTNYGPCSKPCSGGTQMSTRTLYTGSEATCGGLTRVRVCNPQSCA